MKEYLIFAKFYDGKYHKEPLQTHVFSSEMQAIRLLLTLATTQQEKIDLRRSIFNFWKYGGNGFGFKNGKYFCKVREI